jgi:hypothetical protein
MNRETIVREVNSFYAKHGISADDGVVGYGAAAVLHGIRPTTNDIDIDVHPSEFDYVASLEGTTKGKCLTGEFVAVGKVDCHVEEHESDVELIDGIWVVGKRTLLRQYRWLFNHPNRCGDKRKHDLNVIRALTRTV